MRDDQNWQTFKEEVRELLGGLEQTLLELEVGPDDHDLINSVFRALHTIKGTGAMFGFDTIADFAHEVETVFGLVREDRIPVTKELIDLIFQARDHLQALLEDIEAGGGTEVPAGEAILDSLRCLAPEVLDCRDPGVPEAGGETEAPAGDGPSDAAVRYRIHVQPRDPAAVPEPFDPAPLFEELAGLGECRVETVSPESPTESFAGSSDSPGWPAWEAFLTTVQEPERIRDVFFFADIDLDVRVEPLDPEQVEPVQASQDDGDDPEAGPEKLGEILVGSGELAPEDLNTALASQKRLGRILAESGLVSEEAVEHAVRKQEEQRRVAADRARNEAASSQRVSSDKLDRLVDLVGELVIVQARMSQLVGERADPRLALAAEELERLSNGLRDSALGIRMLPIGTAFTRFRRLVRDLSDELGKQAELATEGEETELDRTVLERLGDPLVHLLRNALDHGIESPEEREAAGKPPRGVILLSAGQSSGEVLIRIIDDGRGIDAEAVRATARARGVLGPDVELTDKEAFQLIFEPGFSTTKVVTGVSGRGVGLDVVKRAIEALRGCIEIESVHGKGTTITMRLPLTLAIIEGLEIQVGDGFFVIPLSLVEECVELTDREGEQDGKNVFSLRDQVVPYIRLGHWFRCDGARPEVEQIVITGVEGRRVGIVVDQVIGEHQTVIRALGKVYKDVEGISGATIKGDGSIALILDVPGLIRRAAAGSD